METTADLKLFIEGSFVDDDGQDVYDETTFYYSSATVDLGRAQDITDIFDTDEARYSVDVNTVNEMEADIADFLGDDGQLTGFEINWD